MKPILEIQNLSKRFIIGHESEPYLSLRERLTSGLKFSKEIREEFWALKDINFDINPGDSVGIIGRNGAGKSTLLKILSKITPPTAGKVICRGRIASLLEVGTGFHPELSGRENVYLNGSILGMKKREIDARFDEIVDFAGTEQFLDTPLKHYSSGMQLRLAFAVAAFLEPEVLVIDEVLAVGDAEFQKKCLGKMENIHKSGRTIVFVSHNMQAVTRLCSRAILLNKGAISKSGNAMEIAQAYELEAQNIPLEYVRSDDRKDLFFSRVTFSDLMGQPKGQFDFQEPIQLRLFIQSNIAVRGTAISVAVLNMAGTRIFLTENDFDFIPGQFQFVITVPAEKLAPGQFTLYLALHMPNRISYEELDQVCRFSVVESGSPYFRYGGKWDCGSVVLTCDWDQLN